MKTQGYASESLGRCGNGKCFAVAAWIHLSASYQLTMGAAVDQAAERRCAEITLLQSVGKSRLEEKSERRPRGRFKAAPTAVKRTKWLHLRMPECAYGCTQTRIRA